MTITKYMSACLAGVSMLALPGVALAQVAEMNAAAPQSDADNGDARDIVVTGSRVSNGNSSPTPVTVVSTETLLNLRPSTIADTLQTIPVFAGSRSTLNTPIATGGSGAGNGAANQLNLRNVGSQRNLILMDGRRMVPTSVTNVIDIDMVPQMMIERVETVTGGVSAVYGSDAITGVVNFITNKNFNGVKAQAQYGISQTGNGGQYEAGLAAGTDLFGGRGHIEASYEFRNDRGILRRSEQDWWTRAVVAGNGTAAIPYQLVENGNLANLPFGGKITCGNPTATPPVNCALNNYYFASNGVASPFVNGTPVVINNSTIANFQVGGAGGYYDGSLKASLRTHQLFGHFRYDLTDDIQFFAMGTANFKRNQFAAEDLTINGLTLRSTNAFLATSLTPLQQSQLAAAGSTFSFSRIVNQGDTRVGAIINSTQWMGATGLSGKLGDTFEWNVAYTHGESRLDTLLVNNVNEQKLRASLDAVSAPGGAIVCGINADAIATNNDASCVPFNPFGPTATTAGALDYVLGDTRYVAHTYLDDIVADISGSPFDTWAGPVNVALSGEWRKTRFNATSEAESNLRANCQGLLNCTQGVTPLWRQGFASNPPISDRVIEGAAEIELPLVKDVTFIKAFTVNGAARYTKYNTVGEYFTWKLGASWELDDDLRFRGTISRDIRAPTLNDLFAPASQVTNAQPDRLTGNSVSAPQDTLGNPDLTPERGHTWTIGGVWKPSYVPGFSVAVDYYNIKIKNAVVLAPGFSPLYQDACYDSGGTSLFCSLQERPLGYSRTPANQSAANNVTKYYVKPFNIGQIATYGVDVEMNYATTLGGQRLNLRALTSWQPHIRYIQAGVPTTDQGGVAFGPVGMSASPKWRLTGIVSYQATDNFRFDVQTRWRSGLKFDSTPGITWVGADGIGSYMQTALNMAFTVPDEKLGNMELFFNIQNIFNRDPDPAAGTGTVPNVGRQGGFSQADDPMGRYFTAGARIKF